MGSKNLVAVFYIFPQTKYQSYKICFFIQNVTALLIVFLFLISIKTLI